MEISTTSTTTSPATPATTSTSQISSDFETFLKMLTVQMENQDPLNPVDSSDYAVQLATFSNVEQQVQTNDILRSLQSQLGTSGIAQMADFVGKEARSTAAVYVDGSPITLYPSFESGAETGELVVRDASGTEVARLAVPTDGSAVEWAGVTEDGYPYPAGNYTFDVLSYSGEDLLGTSPAAAYATVTEVRRATTGETIVVLAGDVAVPSEEITALRAAG